MFIRPQRLKNSKISSTDCEALGQVDAEKGARQLSERGRLMYELRLYELRHVGFEWREIAQKLNTTDAAVHAEFSCELKRPRLKLTKKCPTKTDSRDQKDSTRQRECNS
jgi:hypothetical protein